MNSHDFFWILFKIWKPEKRQHMFVLCFKINFKYVRNFSSTWLVFFGAGKRRKLAVSGAGKRQIMSVSGVKIHFKYFKMFLAPDWSIPAPENAENRPFPAPEKANQGERSFMEIRYIFDSWLLKSETCPAQWLYIYTVQLQLLTKIYNLKKIHISYHITDISQLLYNFCLKIWNRPYRTMNTLLWCKTTEHSD